MISDCCGGEIINKLTYMNNFFHKNNVILLKKKKDHIIKVLMHVCSPLLMTLARAAPNLKSRGSNICFYIGRSMNNGWRISKRDRAISICSKFKIWPVSPMNRLWKLRGRQLLKVDCKNYKKLGRSFRIVIFLPENLLSQDQPIGHSGRISNGSRFPQ